MKPRQIHHALAAARADATRLAHFIERRESFLDALDWSMLTKDLARQPAMLDDLRDGSKAVSILYIDWLVERLANDPWPLPGMRRYTPYPRPWHTEQITLAA